MVTEDSDALLFGARTVYKNIFSDKKFVEVTLQINLRPFYIFAVSCI